jgi:acetyl esterase/lipase
MILALTIVMVGSVYGFVSSADDGATGRLGEIVEPSGMSFRRLRPITPMVVDYKPGLEADVYQPSGRGPFPAVLLIHGGGFYTGSRHDLDSTGLRLANQGILAATIDYTLNGLYEPARTDATDALHWLEHLDGVDRSRIALLGRSAGAYLSAYVGYGDNTPRALVLVASPGIASDRITRRAPETLLVHGAADGVVPYAVAKQYVQALNEKDVPHTLIVARGVDHMETLARNWDAIEAWLVPRLKAGSN